MKISIGIKALLCSCLLPLFIACTEWNDHYEDLGNVGGGSSQTLWEQLKSNNSLSDFCEVRERPDEQVRGGMGVWRPHLGGYEEGDQPRTLEKLPYSLFHR